MTKKLITTIGNLISLQKNEYLAMLLESEKNETDELAIESKLTNFLLLAESIVDITREVITSLAVTNKFQMPKKKPQETKASTGVKRKYTKREKIQRENNTAQAE